MIRFIDDYKEYDNGTKALKGLICRIDDGEFVFLVVHPGLEVRHHHQLITGEIALTQGKLMVNGYSLNNISPRQVPLMRRTLGIIFQDFRLIDKKTVYEKSAFATKEQGLQLDLKRASPYIPAGGAGSEGGPLSRPALRRGAAARSHCPGAGEQPQYDHRRRAHREPGPQPLSGDHDAAGADQRAGTSQCWW